MKYFLIYCTVSLLLIVANLTAFVQPIYSLDGLVLNPIQKGIYNKMMGMEGIVIFFHAYQSLDAQNTKLKEENYDLERYKQAYQKLNQENAALRAQLGINNIPKHQYILADITSIDMEGGLDLMKLDVGTNQGVQVGQMVTYKGSLLGTVNKVNAFSSNVRLISTVNSTIPVKIGNSSIQGEVKGTVGNRLIIDDIFANENIQVGDLVETSGLGGTYIPDLLIGTVESVDNVESAPSRNAYVKTLIDPSNLYQVFIIKN